MHHAEDKLDTTEAAAYVGYATQTLANKRVTGGGPRYIKLGRKVVYRRGDLVAWLSEREHESTAQY